MTRASRIERLDYLKDQLRKRVVILDGAMGTNIQKFRLEEEDYRGERFADAARYPNDLKNNNDLLVPTEAREVFDVSGAGDTSLASLGAALAAGATVPEALVVSNVAAGIVVGKFGTASVTGAELKKALEEKALKASSWHHRNNILTPEAAAELAERFRREKKVVGFTNGCFDLLHLGHLHSFMKAREACDVLFVGLNTDASIKRLKGEDRPINNEEMRSLLLASLDFIDYVVPFDEDTALPLIEKLRPDVIAKEGYPLERWPEGQYVTSYGGQALELPRLEGFSSTNIINRMKNSPE